VQSANPGLCEKYSLNSWICVQNGLLLLTAKDKNHQTSVPPHTPQPFYTLFPEPSRWASARRELLHFMVQGKIKRGRHTNHSAGGHSIRTNQCPPPPSHFFTGQMPFLPPNQQCQSTEGN